MAVICVAYATLAQQLEISLSVTASCTVALAIRRSGILQQFSEIRLEDALVGIHGKRVALDALVRAGDRIEIYRPLVIDPKQARLLRAQRRLQRVKAD